MPRVTWIVAGCVVGALLTGGVVWMLVHHRLGTTTPGAAPVTKVRIGLEGKPDSRGLPKTPAHFTLSTSRPTTQPSSRPAPESQPAIVQLAPAAVAAAYAKGLELLKAGDMLGARVQLSEALYSGKLDAPAEATVRGELARLAKALVFSSEVLGGDPYSFHYTILPGDMLVRVDRLNDLRVPAQMILLVNGLARAEDIRPGQHIKLIRGPVCAVVSKGRFLMDLYLKRDDLPPVWIASMPVGLGRNGSTPPGMWRLARGGKLVRPVWNPPPSSDVKGPISYGQENYALGQKGLWMALEGIDDNTRDKADYGIHSTCDQASIGKEGSLGCIRLADKDIELAFATLYDGWSTVEVRP